MAQIFLKLLNISITASYLVLAVLLARLLLKKAPRWISVCLWAMVGLRLVLPVSVESILSLIPSSEPLPQDIFISSTPQVNTGIPVVNSAVNPILENAFSPAPGASVNPMQVLGEIGAWVWAAGVIAMGIYTAVSYWRLRWQVREGVRQEGNVYLCDRIPSPFILGTVNPRIYLPSATASEDIPYVLAHERAHLQRFDHIWKPLAFFLLSIYWINPVLWLAYWLLCRDIEVACDEKVMKSTSADIKKPYANALINCSVTRKSIALCPLAFGEVGVKQRIRNVLNYKRPAFWILAVALVLTLVIGVCFLTDPRTNDLPPHLEFQICQWIQQENRSERTDDHYVTVNYEIIGTEKSDAGITVYMWVYYMEYSFDGQIREETGSHMLTAITAQKQEGNHYRLVQYWNPKDGAGYADSIREKLPWYLHGKGLDSQRTVEALRSLSRAKAEAHYQAIGPSVVPGTSSPAHDRYLGLDASNGLTVYVYQMAQNSYRCLLLPGYGTKLSMEASMEMIPTDLSQMRDILNSYHLPSDKVLVIPYQMIYSSYITPTDQEHVQFLRYCLGLDAQMELKLPYIQGYHIEGGCQVSCAGWQDNWDIYRNAVNAKVYTEHMDFSGMLPIHPIHSREQLQSFLEEYDDKLDLFRESEGIPSFFQAQAQFDEAFFQENSLILIYVRPNKGTERFMLSDIQYTTDKALHFEILRHRGADTEDQTGYLLCIRVDKLFSQDCKSYSASFYGE